MRSTADFVLAACLWASVPTVGSNSSGWGRDKVRQYSQGSSDGGKTCKPEYDFTYIRKK
jgi:hypothetical protein